MGLAVLTEAVLVAPLDGIEVRIMSNSDGSEFLSIVSAAHQAAGTAQALGVRLVTS